MTKVNYQVTGHDVEVTQSLHGHVVNCLDKSFKTCTASPNLEVILRFSKHAEVAKRNTVVVNVRAMGKDLISKTSTGADMYAVIKEVAKKISDEILAREKKKRLTVVKSARFMEEVSCRKKVA